MKEAEVGAERKPEKDAGLQGPEIAAYLERNAKALDATQPSLPSVTQPLAAETARTLRELAQHLDASQPARLEEVERRLTVLEEKLLASLLAATPDEEIVGVRADADRELAPYRRNMSAPQIEQLQKQYIHKRLLERYGVPRLSLFYM
jgi:hypothetical protein